MAASKITGVIKQKKREVIVIDDDSSDEDDGYDTDNTYADMPYMVKPEYDTSNHEDEDEDIDIGTPEVEEDEDIQVKRILPPHLRSVPALGRGIKRLKKKQTLYVPGTLEFTSRNVTNVRSNEGHFQGMGVLNLAYLLVVSLFGVPVCQTGCLF